MQLSLGISPCPNDTFIFAPILLGLIDTDGLDLKVQFLDVQQLNQEASAGNIQVCKQSFFAYKENQAHYHILESGAALGKGVGPLLISHSTELCENLHPELLTLIPGENTTAHFLLQFAYPSFNTKKAVLFSAIEQALLDKEADYGVIIHENRFTYVQKGLHKVADLGQIWEESTNSPIPLGGIFVHKSISKPVQKQVNTLIRKSIAFAFKNPGLIQAFIKEHAQEMDDTVIQQHIDLYVNDYSISLGESGKKAVLTLFNHISVEYGCTFPSAEHIFVA